MSVNIPGWLANAAENLVKSAEDLFHVDLNPFHPPGVADSIPGGGRGAERKQWVKDNLKKIARQHDIKAIPNWIETPMEDALIDVLVETTFRLTVGRYRRAMAAVAGPVLQKQSGT